MGSWVQSLGWENPLEEGMATYSSILAWRISWTKEPSGLQSIGLQKSWTWLKWLSTEHIMRKCHTFYTQITCIISTSDVIVEYSYQYCKYVHENLDLSQIILTTIISEMDNVRGMIFWSNISILKMELFSLAACLHDKDSKFKLIRIEGSCIHV